MNISSRKEAFFLFIGDAFFFIVSLWLTLLVRYGGAADSKIFADHLAPFSILFIVWFLVFFIAGLYEKHTLILKSRLPTIILNTQIINSVLAVLFFYFIPYFGITPKTNLFIYLVISFGLILVWRIYGEPLFGFRGKQNALLIGSGEEMRELLQEVNNNSRYNLYFISSIDLDNIEALDFQEEILQRIYAENVRVIAADLRNEKVEPILPHLYNLIFSKIRFIDMYKIYEDIFDRVPLSLVKYSWFLENISTTPKFTYDFGKRLMDIIISFILGMVSLILYPLVFIAVKLEDWGVLFTHQKRIGKNNKSIDLIKFRTMKFNDDGEWNTSRVNYVTKVGKFLRKTRIDELPQLWNVLKGDISLIGPRPEFPYAVSQYEKQVPYYNIRHLITPGLSGWAQIYHENHPHHGIDLKETKTKLSYDLYYIKNRSFMLDIKIALKTLKTFVSRGGR